MRQHCRSVATSPAEEAVFTTHSGRLPIGRARDGGGGSVRAGSGWLRLVVVVLPVALSAVVLQPARAAAPPPTRCPHRLAHDRERRQPARHRGDGGGPDHGLRRRRLRLPRQQVPGDEHYSTLRSSTPWPARIRTSSTSTYMDRTACYGAGSGIARGGSAPAATTTPPSPGGQSARSTT